MASNAFFLDSNGWVALLNTRESLNRAANARWVELSREQRPVVLTDWIVAETGNGVARTPARNRFVETVQQMFRNPRFRILPVTPVTMERALLLYSDRPDKT
jgi:predicted nucleic acid-binding protein